ncbi:MAG: bifunctional enoyl-CoA hydratase/phosphate acetyltransferase [Magnetococcales bacterium]|nr:bifunctional enoyl-CoA hydratase/phosphate acetyltransferase [Magnetococcales bacterium]
MAQIENKTIDEIQVGDSCFLERRLTRDDIHLFAIMSGDVNPAHLDDDYAQKSIFHEVIAHGMWGGALISTVLGTQLPGPGTIYLEQTLKFKRPVTLGDVVRVTLRVLQKNTENRRVTFECLCTNQKQEVVISGEATVLAPSHKISRPVPHLPEIRMMGQKHWTALLMQVKEMPVVKAVVVHPVSPMALEGVLMAARAGIIDPILVGPKERIRQAAMEANLDMDTLEIIDTPHSHASASRAVSMARQGDVQTVINGSLPVKELFQAVLHPETGLRTDKRASHVFAYDVPTYDKMIYITDAGITPFPTLENKRDIIQNAIDLVRRVAHVPPKVAILAASDEISAALPSTIDAATLCKMAERNQIKGGILDGPLAFDSAISPSAAKYSKLNSPVAGQADILVAPDLESAHLLAKQLEHLADAKGAGIIIGTRVPVILPTHAEDAFARMASCALATLMIAKAV